MRTPPCIVSDMIKIRRSKRSICSSCESSHSKPQPFLGATIDQGLDVDQTVDEGIFGVEAEMNEARIGGPGD